MRIIVALCLLVTFVALAESRSARGSLRGRFAALLNRRKGGLFGNRNRGIDSIFSHIAANVKKPICYFDKVGVPQMTWPQKEKLCFDDSFAIPYDQLFQALETDPDALETILILQDAFINRAMNSTGLEGAVRYKDLCSEHGQLLERIWWTNTMNNQREVCYVITPEYQNVVIPFGGGNCMMDNTVVKHHYCVPDGFVDRDIYVFCPGELKQCRRTVITVPTGCSCKKYTCKKYQKV